MTKERLIEYRDKLNNIVLIYQKKNKKWSILSTLMIIIGILFVIVPAMIVGDNNGEDKPLYFFVLVIIGLIVIIGGLFSLCIFIYNKSILLKHKNYKDAISHELTYMSRNGLEESSKDFSYLDKINI